MLQRRRRRLLTGLLLAGFAVLGAYVIAGSTSELNAAAAVLTRVSPYWLVLAGGLEVASFVAFAQGQRVFLAAAGRDVPLATMSGIVTAGQAIANCIPAGVAASSAYTFQQLLRRRISVLVAAEVQVAQSLVYVATLALLALAGIGVAGGTNAIPDLQYVALGMLGLTAALLAVGVYLQRRGSVERFIRWVIKRVYPSRSTSAAERGLALTTRVWTAASLAATASWIFDCGCLAASFAAVGTAPPWRGLLLAYTAGQLATMLPISPGGLGVVEGSLTVALVAFGGSEPVTLAAVLLYRLFSYWAVLPAGLVSHLLVRRTTKEA